MKLGLQKILVNRFFARRSEPIGILARVSAARPYLGLPQGAPSSALGRGLTQLSLVEHALCPLDAQTSLRPNLDHTAAYYFSDRQGNRRKAMARNVPNSNDSTFNGWN